MTTFVPYFYDYDLCKITIFSLHLFVEFLKEITIIIITSWHMHNY